MFIKKIIISAVLMFSSFLFVAEAKTPKPATIETIQFKDLTEFDACFLIYRSPISFNLKDMLRDYMKFREFTCTKYDEILKRATIVKVSFPKKSKAYELNKKKK